MQRIGLVLLVLALMVACTSERDLESRAAADLRTCVERGGLGPMSDVVVEIGEDRRLVDWNATYPNQGTLEADNIHNACVRTIVADLELIATLP